MLEFSFIKLAGPNQLISRIKSNLSEFLVFILIVLNCTINDNFVSYAFYLFEKNRGAAGLILNWQDQFKIKEKKKNNIRNQYD